MAEWLEKICGYCQKNRATVKLIYMRADFPEDSKKTTNQIGGKMKVTFKCNIGSYSGTLNDMTYGSYRDGSVCIGRKWVQPAPTAQQASLGSAAKNLSALYKSASAGYKADLKSYAGKYGKERVSGRNLPPNAYAIFIRMMYDYRSTDAEHINLETIDKATLTGMNAPVMSVKDAIDAGLLPSVSDAGTLIAEM